MTKPELDSGIVRVPEDGVVGCRWRYVGRDRWHLRRTIIASTEATEWFAAVEVEPVYSADHVEALLRANADLDQWLGALLAVVHRDGGHYQAEYGTDEAVAVAMPLSCERVGTIADLERMLGDAEVALKAIAEPGSLSPPDAKVCAAIARAALASGNKG